MNKYDEYKNKILSFVKKRDDSLKRKEEEKAIIRNAFINKMKDRVGKLLELFTLCKQNKLEIPEHLVSLSMREGEHIMHFNEIDHISINYWDKKLGSSLSVYTASVFNTLDIKIYGDADEALLFDGFEKELDKFEEEFLQFIEKLN